MIWAFGGLVVLAMAAEAYCVGYARGMAFTRKLWLEERKDFDEFREAVMKDIR